MISIKKEMLTNRTNRPSLRDATQYAIRELKGIIAHWTANTKAGADAMANRNYFNGSAMYASAHYIVDDKVIIQCIPDNEVGYHVGAKTYRPIGTVIMGNAKLSPNYYVVGFEMCVNSDGDWKKTYKNSVKLAAHLLYKYQFTTDKLYRHFDITGKDCPKMMLTDASWNQFKQDVQKEMAAIAVETPIKLATVKDTDSLNVRSGGGTAFPIVEKLKKDAAVQIFEEGSGWSRIGTKKWVSSRFLEITSTTQWGVVEAVTGANIRKGPGGNFAIEDAVPVGTMLSILERSDRWLRIGQDRWVAASIVKILDTQSGVVTGTESLNIRKGPATTFPIVRKIPKDARVTIFEKSGSWLRIGYEEWVFSSFIQLD